MNQEKQKKLGLDLLNQMIESVDRNKAKGRIEVARGDFGRAAGILLTLQVLGIVDDAETQALRDNLFTQHYVHA